MKLTRTRTRTNSLLTMRMMTSLKSTMKTTMKKSLISKMSWLRLRSMKKISTRMS